MSYIYELWSIFYCGFYGFSALQLPGKQIEIINEFAINRGVFIPEIFSNKKYFGVQEINYAIKIDDNNFKSKRVTYLGYVKCTQNLLNTLQYWCLQAHGMMYNFEYTAQKPFLMEQIRLLFTKPVLIYFNRELDLINLCFLNTSKYNALGHYSYMPILHQPYYYPQRIIVSYNLFLLWLQTNDIIFFDLQLLQNSHSFVLTQNICNCLHEIMVNVKTDNLELKKFIHYNAPWSFELNYNNNKYMIFSTSDVYIFIDKTNDILIKEWQSTQCKLFITNRNTIVTLWKYKVWEMHSSDFPTP
jgi:hypothetical protein